MVGVSDLPKATFAKNKQTAKQMLFCPLVFYLDLLKRSASSPGAVLQAAVCLALHRLLSAPRLARAGIDPYGLFNWSDEQGLGQKRWSPTFRVVRSHRRHL